MSETVTRTYRIEYVITKPYSSTIEPRRFETLDEAFDAARPLLSGNERYQGVQINRDEIEVADDHD